MGERQKIRSREFVLEAGGRAVLALFANNIEHAQTFCSQSWFRDELATCRSSGCLVFDSNSELKIRHADPCEAAELHTALDLEQFRRNMTGLSLRFWCLWMPTCSDVEVKPRCGHATAAGEMQIYVNGVAAKNSGSSTGTSGLSAHFAPTPVIGSVHQMH